MFIKFVLTVATIVILLECVRMIGCAIAAEDKREDREFDQ